MTSVKAQIAYNEAANTHVFEDGKMSYQFAIWK